MRPTDDVISFGVVPRQDVASEVRRAGLAGRRSSVFVAHGAVEAVSGAAVLPMAVQRLVRVPCGGLYKPWMDVLRSTNSCVSFAQFHFQFAIVTPDFCFGFYETHTHTRTKFGLDLKMSPNSPVNISRTLLFKVVFVFSHPVWGLCSKRCANRKHSFDVFIFWVSFQVKLYGRKFPSSILAVFVDCLVSGPH